MGKTFQKYINSAGISYSPRFFARKHNLGKFLCVLADAAGTNNAMLRIKNSRMTVTKTYTIYYIFRLIKIRTGYFEDT